MYESAQPFVIPFRDEVAFAYPEPRTSPVLQMNPENEPPGSDQNRYQKNSTIAQASAQHQRSGERSPCLNPFHQRVRWVWSPQYSNCGCKHISQEKPVHARQTKAATTKLH